MSEVVVNCCHLEIRMEDAQRKQKPLQRKALKPLKDQVTRMVEQPKDTRFTRLCAWTWDNIKESEADAEVELPGSVSASAWTRDDPSRWSQKANPWKKPPMPADEDFDNSAASSPTNQKKKTNEVLLKLPEEIPKQQEKHGSLLSRIAALAPPKDQDESKSKASSVLHKLAEKAQGGFVAVVTQALLEKRQGQAEKEEKDAAKREMQQRRRESELARLAAAAAGDVSNTEGTADKASRAVAAADPKMASRAAAADNQPIDAEDLPMVNEFAAQTPEVLAAEAEVQALQQLLEDTRQNAAAAICSKIKQAEKGGGRNGVSAMQWGNQMLTLLVSEDFAKAATKDLRKTQSMMLH